MPRDGTQTYILPFPDVVADTTIESPVYNGFTNDVAQDLNNPRPISSGGTGATSADTALANLGGEKANQIVTNYDSHLWMAGSFSSATTATSEPVDGHAFSGTAIVTDSNNIVLEARDVADNKLYLRRKTAGTWGAWGDAAAADDARFVNVTGDTMTGALIVNGQISSTVQDGLRITAPVGQFARLNTVVTGGRSWNAGTDNSGNYTIHDATSSTVRYVIGPTGLHSFTGNMSVSGTLGVVGNTTITGTFGVTGDATITGTFVVNGAASATQIVNSTGGVNNIYGQKGGLNRWSITLGDGTVDNFSINSYSDGGALITSPLSISRSGSVVRANTRLHVGPTGTSPVADTLFIGFPGSSTQYGITLLPTIGGATTNMMTFYNVTPAIVGTITSSPTATAYNTSSSAELKEDLKSFDAGSIIDNTDVYDFKWKGTKERAYGVVAQQAVEIYPLAVTHSKQEDGSNEFWGVDYSKYVPVLLQELKALRQRVADLEGGGVKAK